MFIVETFSDFVTAVARYRGECPVDWRNGQCAFNLLVRVRPDLSEMIRGSLMDPFYRDDRLIDFYDYLSRNW